MEGAAEAGAEVELSDIRALDLPFFMGDMLEPPPAAVRLVEATAGTHGMIWSSPLYHGTVSGAFKNAIDWLDLLRSHDPPLLADKIIGLISTAGACRGCKRSIPCSLLCWRCAPGRSRW